MSFDCISPREIPFDHNHLPCSISFDHISPREISFALLRASSLTMYLPFMISHGEISISPMFDLLRSHLTMGSRASGTGALLSLFSAFVSLLGWCVSHLFSHLPSHLLSPPFSYFLSPSLTFSHRPSLTLSLPFSHLLLPSLRYLSVSISLGSTAVIFLTMTFYMLASHQDVVSHGHESPNA